MMEENEEESEHVKEVYAHFGLALSPPKQPRRPLFLH